MRASRNTSCERRGLAGDEFSFVTGQMLALDCGWTSA
jgi:hypothetical protein